MIDLFDLFDKLISEIPDTIEKDGQLYKVKLVPVEKEDLVDTKETVDAFNKEISDIDPEIWNSALEIFAEKYNAKLFDKLVSSDKLTKDEFSQLTNGIEAFKGCVIAATTNRINYLTDKYIHGNVLSPTED